MTEMSNLLSATLTEDADMDLWDTPPYLSFVIRKDGDVLLQGLRVPDDLWAAAHPADVLQVLGIVTQTTGLPQTLKPQGELLGVAVFNEAWSLQMDDATEEERAAAMQWVQHNSIEDHPRGRECKVMSGIGVDGYRCLSRFVRGTPEVETIESEDGNDLTGRMFDALQGYLDATVESLR